MSEYYPSDAELNALSGSADSEQEVLFVATGQSPYYTSFYKMLYRLLDVSRRSGDLRVYKDGDLTFGVRAGRYMNGTTAVTYAGANTQSLTNNATNYIYLTAAGVLTANTTGFPIAATTPHVPLATITTAAGTYSLSDVTDYRGRAFIRVLDGVSAADRQDRMPGLSITAGTESSDKRTVTIQVQDAGGNSLAQRFRVRVWLATSDYGAPSATGNTVAVETGTTLQAVTANADYHLISDANGVVAIGLTISSTATRYVLAEIDGRIWSSGQLVWA